MARSDPQASLRRHVLWLFDGGDAHPGIDAAFDGLPVAARGFKPPGQAHTPWRLLEHIRIAQRDILEYCQNPSDHRSPPWPAGYWPDGDAPPSAAAWRSALASVRRDATRLRAMIADRARDLLEPLPDTPGHTLLRESLLCVDHTSYHLGQAVLIRTMAGW